MRELQKGHVLGQSVMKDLFRSFLRNVVSFRPRFNGRATRRDLFLTLVFCISASTFLFEITAATDSGGQSEYLFRFDVLLTLVTIAALYLPLIAVMVRRFHDTNRSAFDMWIIVIPYGGILWFIGILLWSGDTAENNYGPNPRPIKV